MASEVKEEKERRSSALLLELYADLLVRIWEIVSELIGEAILAFLFNLSIRTLQDKHPFLKSLKVSEEGISVEGLRQGCRGVPPAGIHRAFQGLITQLFDLFAALTEGVISRELLPKVLPKIREAERISSQK